MRVPHHVLRAALAVAAFSLFWPQLVGLPLFRQNPAILESALFFSRNLNIIELACAAAAFISLWIMIREGLTQRQVLLGLGVFLVAGLSRIDIYSAIFHPLERPAYTDARETTLDAREKLLAISVKGMVRAYPVRSLSYHHVVNDVLEGVAVAATY